MTLDPLQISQALLAALALILSVWLLAGGVGKILAAPDALSALHGVRLICGPGAAAALIGVGIVAVDTADWGETLAFWGRLLLLGLALGVLAPAVVQSLAQAAFVRGDEKGPAP